MTPDPTFLAVACSLGMTPVVLLLAERTTHRRRHLGLGETAAAAALVGLLLSTATAGRSAVEATALASVLAIALAAATVDTLEGRLPDELTAGLAIGAALAVLARSAVVGDIGPVLRASVAAGLLLAGCLILKVAADDAIGWGDVKFVPTLAALVAAWRPDGLVVGAIVAVLLVELTAVGVAALERTRRTHVPYGPALLAGAVAGLAVVL
jgi:leader peptidase (prepilin peptidase)/N-methyltransferase